jgi:hypothetical protein
LLEDRGKPRKHVSRWPVAGPSGCFEAEAPLNNSVELVRISKKTTHLTITKINWLMLFKEIITVYIDSHI